VTVRVCKKSLILQNVADAVVEADCKQTKGIYSTYSLISESVAKADDGRGPLITYKWNNGLIQIARQTSPFSMVWLTRLYMAFKVEYLNHWSLATLDPCDKASLQKVSGSTYAVFYT
jgi:hypothetical protein